MSPVSLIYIIKQDIRIYIYMSPITGQTAGPIGPNLLVDTHGWPEGVLGYQLVLYKIKETVSVFSSDSQR